MRFPDLPEAIGRPRLSDEDKAEISRWWERSFGKSGGKETDLIPEGLST